MRLGRSVLKCGLLLALVWIMACSTASRRRLAEALFDDPPSRRQAVQEAPPPQVAPAPGPRPGPRPARWQGSTHGPFAAQLCQACHLVAQGGRVAMAGSVGPPPGGRSGSLLRLPATALCRNCHRDPLLATPAREVGSGLHGPVAAGLCQACHLPHRSRQPSLLRSPAAEVCGGCHLTSSLLPEHPGEGRACLECHDPHAPGRAAAS